MYKIISHILDNFLDGDTLIFQCHIYVYIKEDFLGLPFGLILDDILEGRLWLEIIDTSKVQFFYSNRFVLFF